MDQKLVFFVILFLLYLVHDVALSWLFKRKHHRNDNFIGKNSPNDVQRYFGKAIKFILSYYILILVYLATDFNFWGLISDIALLDKQIVQIGGFVLSALALLLMVLARLNLGASWRIGLDHSTKDSLITHGFYSYIRNPYFTFLIAFEGFLILISPNAVMICAFIQSILLLGLQVRQEEIFLGQKYGEQYNEYMKRTGRFLPKIL